MKTKIHKKFNEFLDEASKPDYAFLDLAHARRRGRVAIIVQKIKDKQNGVNIPNSLRRNPDVYDP